MMILGRMRRLAMTTMILILVIIMNPNKRLHTLLDQDAPFSIPLSTKELNSNGSFN